MIKLCKDCIHQHNRECFAPQVKRTINLLTGEEKRAWMFCEIHREDVLIVAYTLGTCGKRGRWYVPK